MQKKTIYLIRHALPAYPNGERMCLGQKNDLPLSAEGHAQAELLSRAFRHIELEAVYASPLLRAKQTAACIAGDNRPLCVLQDLIELHGGEWDGRSFAELHAEYPEYFADRTAHPCPPGGESDQQGLERILSALAHVEQHTERCAAMVAHSGVNRILLCALLGRPFNEKRNLRQDYACVSVLECADGVWDVRETGLSPQAFLALQEG